MLADYLILCGLQCQSQLKALYAEGIEGCDMEFAAYNLLCAILHSSNNRDLLSSMSRSVALPTNVYALFACLSELACYVTPAYEVVV